MAKVKPIKPSEVKAKKTSQLPDEMIETVNKLIVKHWNGSSATVKQNEIKSEFLKLYNANNESNPVNAFTMFENKWMDFEDAFKDVGWKVEYDKPGYNESYDAYFVFKK